MPKREQWVLEVNRIKPTRLLYAIALRIVESIAVSAILISLVHPFTLSNRADFS